MSLRRSMMFSLGGLDADAVAFINAASITNVTQKAAINTYVKGLKSKSLWTRLIALYPFVGGNSTSHRYNLINPSNFLITFSGGVTHNSDGVTFDGINGYANTGIIPSTSFTLNNESLFIYSRTSEATATLNEVDMGAVQSTSQRDVLILRTSANAATAQINSTSNSSGAVISANLNASGLILASRINSTDLRLFRNGSQIGTTSTSTNNGTRSTISMYIGCRNVNGTAQNFINRNYALAGCGLGFNSTQNNDFYTLTQAFQTALGRQV